RCLIVGQGSAGAVPYFGLHMQDRAHLAAYAAVLRDRKIRPEPSPTPLFGDDAFSVSDPDGRRIVFGLSSTLLPSDGAAARLQHFVCATTRLAEMVGFYRDKLGLLESDRVLEGTELAAAFLR